MKNFFSYNFLINLNFKFSEEIKHLYLFSLLRAIILISSGVFLPYFIYKTLGFYYVLLYQTLVFFSRIIALPFIKQILKIKSIEFSYFLSIFFTILQFLSIYFINLKENPIFIIIPAIFGGLSMITYWLPLHSSIILFATPKKRMEERIIIDVIISIVKIIFPFIMALIIFLIDFEKSFLLIALTIMVVSFYLLKIIGKQKKERKIDLKLKKPPFFISGLILFCLESLLYVNLFLFFLIVANHVNIKELGSLVSISSVLAILFAFYLSKRVDKFKDYTLAILGILIITSLYLHVYFTEELKIILFAFLIGNAITTLITIPYLGWFYTIGKKIGVEIAFFRELIISLVSFITYFLIMFYEVSLYKAFYILTLFQILFALIYYFNGRKIEIEEELTVDFFKQFKEIKTK